MGLENKHQYQDIFDSYTEYQKYLKRAYALFQELKKSRDPSFKKIIPEYLEVAFCKNIKSPRLYFPRNKGIVVVELPTTKSCNPKKRGVLREKTLISYAPIVKITEKSMADEFAISEKLFDKK